MTDRSLHVGPVIDQLDQYASIFGESLLCPDRNQFQTYIRRIGTDNVRGVYQGDQLIGGLTFYRMSQWFGGRPIPCAGISGVAISPDQRGGGACGCLLQNVLTELRSRELPLASLYASTQNLYRGFGFEQAGTQTQYSIPISSIGTVDRSLPVHRYQSPPLDKLNFVADHRSANTNGNLSRTDGLWQRLLEPYDGRGTLTYLFGDQQRPEGYVILKCGTRDLPVPQPLVCTDVALNTPAAHRRLLTLVHDHRSMCNSFQWYGPLNDPLILFADEQWVTVKDSMRWMLRVIDVARALAQRGYPSGVSGKLELDIEDELFVENSGHWQLDIANASATAQRGGRGLLRLNARALAALYSSHFTAEQLLRWGRIESDDEQQTRLASAAFAGEPAWLTEIF